MTQASLAKGAVIFVKDYEFDDGSTKDKLLVVLGTKEGQDYLCAQTTSVKWRRDVGHGCYHGAQTYFFLEGNGKNFFSEDTWILLSQADIYSSIWLLNQSLSGKAKVVGEVKPDVAGQIRNSYKESRDASPIKLALL